MTEATVIVRKDIKEYRCRRPQYSSYYQCIEDNYETFERVYEKKYEVKKRFNHPLSKRYLNYED